MRHTEPTALSATIDLHKEDITPASLPGFWAMALPVEYPVINDTIVGVFTYTDTKSKWLTIILYDSGLLIKTKVTADEILTCYMNQTTKRGPNDREIMKYLMNSNRIMLPYFSHRGLFSQIASNMWLNLLYVSHYSEVAVITKKTQTTLTLTSGASMTFPIGNRCGKKKILSDITIFRAYTNSCLPIEMNEPKAFPRDNYLTPFMISLLDTKKHSLQTFSVDAMETVNHFFQHYKPLIKEGHLGFYYFDSLMDNDKVLLERAFTDLEKKMNAHETSFRHRSRNQT